ncbi:rubredoxin [Maribacter sp. PR1]|uniref:Rubredoxin n=1 Tax=Maribacter cobaltidurans TaxID=1178778 RepID=A0ABU7IY43_9FLAO|nr:MULTISPECIES: rubredoxin [Maribacter]MDC6390510.1 rubredoxin [Maribacter sp. PR1]MEE1977900.1 rubredoxin [Maribacter cobaltidurans]
MNEDLHRILLKGGVTSPGELKDIILMLETAGLKEVYLGSRQDLLFPLKDTNEEQQLEQLSQFNTDIVTNRGYQNIVSSYVSADVFDMTYWLKGSTYLYILEGFDYLPKLKINITDPKQRLVPLFSGNLNFIASDNEEYWYLNVKLPHWKTSAFYPVLIYSWDIISISKAIEEIYEDIVDEEELFFVVNKKLDMNNKAIEKELNVPYLTFPYYEGMNRMGIDQYWLGLYWRNNRYDLSFLKEFCGFCLDNSIGKICFTPWKSFIIKGIKQKSRPELERFLGQRGINVRHSQLEMNWHVPVDDTEALELKKFLVRSFDQNDISTYGLTFGISNDVGKRSHFSSIVIEKNSPPAIVKEFEVRPTYNVLHFQNFDPNTQKYLSYAQDVDKIELPGLLMELSKNYFEQLRRIVEKPKVVRKTEETSSKIVFQCQSCFTIYDKMYGDPKAGIKAGTVFKNLHDSYVCPVCDSPKSKFVKTELRLI